MAPGLKHISFQGERGSGFDLSKWRSCKIVQPGDTVIIISYALVSQDKLAEHYPKVAIMDEQNRIKEIINYEPEMTIM